MTGQKPTDKSAPTVAPMTATTPPAKSQVPVPVAPAPAEAVDVSKLTPEEQMARFAKELQENDWGHQPC